MCNCDVVPCPECGVTPVEHDPDLGGPEPCASCQWGPAPIRVVRESRRPATPLRARPTPVQPVLSLFAATA